MGGIARLLAAGACLLLSGCWWGPGQFGSELEVRKDGSFTLAYRGEILLALGDQLAEGAAAAAPAWNDKLARCHRSGETRNLEPHELDDASAGDDDGDPVRPCTARELADLKAAHAKAQAEKAADKRKEAEQMAKLFGLPGSDEASARAFADKVRKYAGWRSVAYKGKGVYQVDYRFDGRLAQDFLFPMLPDNHIVMPFVAIRRRADGSVLVTASALTGKGGIPLPDKNNNLPVRAKGRFTIITDGEILTNNSEDGPVGHVRGRALHWDVSPASEKVPETLIRL